MLGRVIVMAVTAKEQEKNQGVMSGGKGEPRSHIIGTVVITGPAHPCYLIVCSRR